MMDKVTRLQYLQAMGIDVWIPRHPPMAFLEYADKTTGPDAIGKHSDSNLGKTENLSFHQLLPESDIVIHPGVSVNKNPEPSKNQANEWISLQNQVSGCRSCALCETRTQTVFGTGNRRAGLMLIGEAPGQDEDLQGEPFVGKAGQLLNEMLRAIGFQRQEVYIANMLKCRPPANRDPEQSEIMACNTFLQQQIALLQPKLILAVGRIAAQNLLKTQLTLTKLRGAIHQYGNIPLIVIHHPAYLLRSPLEKAKTWEDLQFVLSVYRTL